MKIRNGFVSNSSSSSFVIVIEKQEFDKLRNSLTDLQKDILSYLSKEEQTFAGIQVVPITFMTGNYSTLEGYSLGDGGTGYERNDDDDDNFSVYEEWAEVDKKIGAIPADKKMSFVIDC